MTTTTALIGLMLAPACACGASAGPDDLLVIGDAKVLSVTRPAAFSGILATFAEVRVIGDRQEATLFPPYFGAEQVLPEVGARCTFRYEERDIEGAVGTTFENNSRASVIRGFDCE